MEDSFEDRTLPDGWVKCHSKSMQGKVYYFNKLTGESIWEHPEANLFNAQDNEKDSKMISQRKNALTQSAKESPSTSISENVLRLDNRAVSERGMCRSSARSSAKKSELKLKPMVKVFKTSWNPLKRDNKGLTIKQNRTPKNSIESENALGFSPGKPVTDGIAPFNRAVRKGKEPSIGYAESLNRTNFHTEDGQFKAKRFHCSLDGESSCKRIQNKRVEYRTVASVDKMDRGDFRDPERERTLPHLCTIESSDSGKVWSKKAREVPKEDLLRGIDRKNGEVSGPVVCAKAPVMRQVSTKKSAAKAGNATKASVLSSQTSPISAENIFQLNRSDSPRTFGSVGALSDSRSQSCTSSDVDMSGFMETEGSIERNKGDTANIEEFEDEEMEVDDVELISKKILKQIEDIRVDRIEVPKIHMDGTDQAAVEFQQENSQALIVLDTNILLSHLRLVCELRDAPIPGAGRPMLIIPWMVTQELDRLKIAPDSRVHERGSANERISVNVLARRAIGFLHDCFTESHPRVKGETAFEANQQIEGLIQESNDDSILHCCICFKAKAVQTKVVLLSNDRNLCSKAIVHGVKAFDGKTIVSGLRDIFQIGSIIVRKDHFKEYYKASEVQDVLAEKRRKADDLICELQCILREAFAAIVEGEMKDAFDDDWLVIVKIKPPWTLIDTLDLLSKHWIAVFGMIVSRNFSVDINELKRKFKGGDAVLRDLDNAGQLLDLGYKICSAFSRHSDYQNVLPKCMAALTVLQEEYKNYSLSITVNGTKEQINPTPSLPGPEYDNAGQESNDISKCVAKVLHEHSSTDEGTSVEVPEERRMYFNVMSSFDEIWKAVRVLSSLVFRSLDYPDPYESGSNQPSQRSSREGAYRFLGQFIPCLARLVQAIQKVVASPIELSIENADVFTELGQSIAQFMKVLMCQECNITFEELRSFCIDNLCRAALIQGLSQLDRALGLLQHCASFSANHLQ